MEVTVGQSEDLVHFFSPNNYLILQNLYMQQVGFFFSFSDIKVSNSALRQNSAHDFLKLESKETIPADMRGKMNSELNSLKLANKLPRSEKAGFGVCLGLAPDPPLPWQCGFTQPSSDFCFSKDVYSSPRHACLKANHSVYSNGG